MIWKEIEKLNFQLEFIKNLRKCCLGYVLTSLTISSTMTTIVGVMQGLLGSHAGEKIGSEILRTSMGLPEGTFVYPKGQPQPPRPRPRPRPTQPQQKYRRGKCIKKIELELPSPSRPQTFQGQEEQEERNYEPTYKPGDLVGDFYALGQRDDGEC